MALGFCKLSQIQDIATSVKSKLGLDKIKFSEIAPSLNKAVKLGKVSYTSPTFTISEDARHANMDDFLISRWNIGLMSRDSDYSGVEVGNPMNDITVRCNMMAVYPDGFRWMWGGEYASTGLSYKYYTSSGFSNTIYHDGRWDSYGNRYSDGIYNYGGWYGFFADSFTVSNCAVALRKCFARPYRDSWATETSSAGGYMAGAGRIDLLVFSNCMFASDCTMAFDHATGISKIVFEDCDSSIITDVTDMFDACTGLTSLRISPNWLPNESVTKFNLSSCPLDHESCLNVFENIATKSIASTLSIKSTTKALMSDDEIKIATDKGWTISTY